MQQHRLAAIMFTDIVGYTAMMEKDEQAAIKLLRKNLTIHKTLIKKYDGELLKEMGDGILASFSVSSDAVRCAGAIQEALRSKGISLRIGIHEGEVVFDDGDVFGSGVNIASRIEEVGEPNEIHVSDAVYRDVKNKSGMTFNFVGEKVLKNVEGQIKVYSVEVETQPVMEEVSGLKHTIGKRRISYLILAVLLVVIGAVLWQLLPGKNSDQSISENDQSIAVLPFRDDSPDEDNKHLCNGMQNELLTHLNMVMGLNVKSATSVEQYRNPTMSIKEIGAELGVAYLVEGGIQKSGDDLRIHVQLIDAKTGDHLWSNPYDYNGDYSIKIFDFQTSVAKQVVSSLKIVLTPDEEERLNRKPTDNIKAYDLCKRGNQEILNYWRTLNDEYIIRARNLYDRALEIDSTYLKAIKDMAVTYICENDYHAALICFNRVLELDPDDKAYGGRAECYFFLGDYKLAIENYKKHITLAPEGTIGWTNVALGRAYGFTKQGALSPRWLTKGFQMGKYSLSIVYYNIGTFYTNAGYYEKAEEYLQKSMELGNLCHNICSYSWLLAVQSEFESSLEFLDSICGEEICEDLCYKYKFHMHLALKEFDKAAIYIGKLSEKSRSLYLGERFWHKQHVGDSILLAYMHKGLGNEIEADIILENSRLSLEDELQKRKSWWSYLFLSMIHTIQEENEKAIEYLSETENLGLYLGWHDLVHVHPVFENLWDEPEFIRIIGTVQAEKAAIKTQIKEMEERGEIVL